MSDAPTPAEIRACARALLRLTEEDGPLDTPCWRWPGARTGVGYGSIWVGSGRGNGSAANLHALMYRVLVGPVPDGRELHHRCGDRLCGNPTHLDALTDGEHGGVHRREACDRGHEFTAENTFVWGDGQRRCRRCKLDGQRRRRGLPPLEEALPHAA